ncbi:3-deoxy-7-phosphoheptulonate synthase, partial [Nocardiopsis umidischolae]|nr:3-deoxy-7-phosphoheptulonate synthase [Nocardiopsis umidischolae]
MVIVMAPDATPDNIDSLVELVTSSGGEAYVTRGVSRTIIGLVGDVERFQNLG